MSDSENNKYGYMCEVDYDWELGEALGGTKIYPCLDDLKKNHKCWDQCGIIKVKISCVEVIVTGNPGLNK